MSTKIYNGYIFTEKNFFVLNKKLQDLAVKMKKVKNQHAAQAAAQIYANYVDQTVLFGRTPTELEGFTGDSVLDFLTALEKLAKAANLSPYRSDGQWDLECSVSLYPVKSGKILCQFFEQGAVPDYLKLWQQQKYVQDFHYQNSTDRPKAISAPEWRKREKLWNEALSRSSRPLDSGPSFILASADFPTFEIYAGDQAFLNFFPSLENRQQRALEEYSRHQFFQNPDHKKMLDDTTQWMEAFRLCAEYQKTHAKSLTAEFNKIYGDKFLDLAQVVKKGLSGLVKGQI
jgi:hypothetical protein